MGVETGRVELYCGISAAQCQVDNLSQQLKICLSIYTFNSLVTKSEAGDNAYQRLRLTESKAQSLLSSTLS